MIKKMYCIYDMKALVYSPPFYCSTNGEATRAFADSLADSKSPHSSHPEDYVLYEVGAFDYLSGVVTPVSPIHTLGSGVEFLKPV